MNGYTFLEDGDFYELRQEYMEFRNKYVSSYVFCKIMLKLSIFIKDDWGFMYVNYDYWEDLVKGE